MEDFSKLSCADAFRLLGDATQRERAAAYRAWLKAEAEKERSEKKAAATSTIKTELFTAGPGGEGLSIVTVPAGCPWNVRFLSEIVTARFHWDRGSKICIGEGCRLCPGDRQVEGFADAIVKQDDQVFGDRIFRAIQGLPESAILQLEGQILAGRAVRFYRAEKRGKVTAKILEGSQPKFALPEACDVKAFLRREKGLTRWPVYDFEGRAIGVDGNILKFRKMG